MQSQEQDTRAMSVDDLTRAIEIARNAGDFDEAERLGELRRIAEVDADESVLDADNTIGEIADRNGGLSIALGGRKLVVPAYLLEVADLRRIADIAQDVGKDGSDPLLVALAADALAEVEDRGDEKPAEPFYLVADAQDRQKAKSIRKPIEGPWDWNGPEEGDKVDLSVWIMHEGSEVMEIRAGTTMQKKATARRITDLLNKGEASYNG